MNSNYFRFKGLGLAGLGMVSAFTTGCNSKAEKEQESVSPNIIVILTDDQGYADLGCYGAKGFETPNLDSLASQGIRFTDFYVAATNSSPSRAALLTGCYPARVGMPSVLAPEGPEWAGERAKTGLNPKEIIIPEILNQKGYKTACFGKWHLGHHKKHLPVNQGFDEYFGLPYSNDMWPQNKSCYPPLPLIEGDSVIDTISGEEQANLTTWYTEKSIDFIERNKDGRFFLYLAHSMPHVPLYVSDKFKGKSEQGLYGDVIMEIDWSVGQIVDKLKKEGIFNNTFIVFFSDNGPWLQYGNHAGSAYPLREHKGTTFDGGQRVPCIMSWPDVIKQGRVCNKMVASIDLYPTFAEITDVNTPDVKIDGKSILPLLKNREKAQTRQVFYFMHNGDVQAVRAGDWKLHVPHNYRHVVKVGTDGVRGEVEFPEIELSLFNLEKDIGEQNNMIEEEPEKTKKLKKMLMDFEQDMNNNVRPSSKAE